MLLLLMHGNLSEMQNVYFGKLSASENNNKISLDSWSFPYEGVDTLCSLVFPDVFDVF